MPRKASKASVWRLASEYNRRKDCDDNGYGKCCSCDKWLHWKDGHGGHFVPQSHGNAVRYEPDNIHLQCSGCNCPKYSSKSEIVKIRYTLFMERRYGIERVRELELESRKILRGSEINLDHWAEFYRAKLKELDNV